MTEHLSDVELHAFHAGRMEPEALLQSDDHLASCETCRGRLAALRPATDVDDLVRGLAAPSAHLSDEDVTGFVMGVLDEGAARNAAQHLEVCQDCARQVADLRSWRRSSPRIPPAWIAIAAAVLLVAAITPFLMRSGPSRPQQPANVVSSSLTTDPEVVAAIAAGTGTLPPFVSDLAGRTEVLLGPAPSQATFRLNAPRATGVVSATPEFSWESVPGAHSYVVSVYDQSGDLVRRSPALTESRWRDDEPLGRGVTYVWQVDATLGARTLTAPVPPEPPARFHVVDAETAARLSGAEAAHPEEHLALGLLYMNAGVVDRARAELQQVPRSDPHAAVADRSLTELDRLRQ